MAAVLAAYIQATVIIIQVIQLRDLSRIREVVAFKDLWAVQVVEQPTLIQAALAEVFLDKVFLAETVQIVLHTVVAVAVEPEPQAVLEEETQQGQVALELPMISQAYR
jgi:hypothetical protein